MITKWSYDDNDDGNDNGDNHDDVKNTSSKRF